jgi:hypothetical protein
MNREAVAGVLYHLPPLRGSLTPCFYNLGLASQAIACHVFAVKESFLILFEEPDLES